MKCIDCVFARDDGLCLCKGRYTLLDADACEWFRPRADVKVKMLKAENAKLREELADALKCETCEAMLDCDECLRTDCSHKERRRLSAENAKLREQIHWLKKGDILHVLTDQEYIDQCERERLMQVSIDALDKENAKLRELLSIMAYCNQFRRDCDGCSMNGAAGIITERAGCDELLASLRELGVEVSE